MFASEGPEFTGHGHGSGQPLVLGGSGGCGCGPGRMNADRGRRSDEAPEGAVDLPPHVMGDCYLSRLAHTFLSPLGFGLVGFSFMPGRLLSLIQAPVADHGKQDSHQAAGHGHVGLGLAEAGDRPLPHGLLAGVGAAQGHAGLAQGPAQGGVAGLGDVPGLGGPADSLLSGVRPVQNSRASALGKRAKSAISDAIMQPQISSIPGTLLRMASNPAQGVWRLAAMIVRRRTSAGAGSGRRYPGSRRRPAAVRP